MLPAQQNRGCLRAQLHADVTDPDAFCYSEEWLTVEDVVREIRSTRFNRLLELMEAASEPPELLFRFVAETRGLDYVAEVRGDRESMKAS
jgi:quinol monooxygenase YgiN